MGWTREPLEQAVIAAVEQVQSFTDPDGNAVVFQRDPDSLVNTTLHIGSAEGKPVERQRTFAVVLFGGAEWVSTLDEARLVSVSSIVAIHSLYRGVMIEAFDRIAEELRFIRRVTLTASPEGVDESGLHVALITVTGAA